MKEMQAFFKKNTTRLCEKILLVKRNLKIKKKFQSLKKKWRVEIIFGKPVGLELACTE